MPRIEKIERVEFVTDHPVPSEMEDGVLYVEGDAFELSKVYFVFFNCPCGCKTLIALPLYNDKKEHTPSWRVSSLDPFTITPSIRQLQGCRSHFFITANEVKWC